MTVTPEQRTYARLAGSMFLANYVLQFAGDGVTIVARTGAPFAETARFAADHELLWRVSLAEVGLAWIATGILAFALYVVLEPVDKRLAQLAFVLRLGASLVGSASMMFRAAQARFYEASATAGVFTAEQLHTLSSTMQRGANGGVTSAWILQGAGAMFFFVLFRHSGYVPRALAGFGAVTTAVLVPLALAAFLFPQGTNVLKLFGVPGLVAEVWTAVLLLRGLELRAVSTPR